MPSLRFSAHERSLSDSPIRIGTRGSKLALWQAHWVADRLRSLGAVVEIVEIVTQGDVQQAGPVPALGLQGVFTKEIQSAVLQEKADLAVHSLKDLPTETTAGLVLAAVPERESVADALVSNSGSLGELSTGARVGTGSLRRQAQIKQLRPELEVLSIRGNVDTRLRKLDEGQYDAIVLAESGLTRLGLEGRITERLGPPRMLPAPGQGALGLECRESEAELMELLANLDDDASRAAVTAERSMLALLHAGCSAPVGAWGRIEDDQLVLDGLVASLDGKQILSAVGAAGVSQAEMLGQTVAEQLLDQGAAEIIAAAKDA